MTDFRQARLANIFLVFEGLTISFPARLPIRSKSSSKSEKKARTIFSSKSFTRNKVEFELTSDVEDSLVTDRLSE